MKDQFFQMDLVLRNNRTTSQYPDGIFHPHAHLHHIKKENIGLIEVMGLAILPARLKDEIAILKKSLLNEEDISKYPFMDKHKVWYNELKQDFINFEVEDRGFSFEKLMRLDTKLTKILKGGLRTNI